MTRRLINLAVVTATFAFGIAAGYFGTGAAYAQPAPLTDASDIAR
tara:strand:+ start:140 stop:274 length:135 start_codon:yes stop_codon:yes gene_type:complete